MAFKNTNVCVLRGGLTRDCEVFNTGGAKQKTKVRFCIGVHGSKYVDDKWEEESYYFDCVWWDANHAIDYLKKGVQVIVTGSLKQRSWETKDGKRSKVEISVNNVEFVTWPKDSLMAEATSQEEQPSCYDEDIPF